MRTICKDQDESRNNKLEDKENPFKVFYQALYSLLASDYNTIDNQAAIERTTLYTTYPGLLIGSGYNHNANTDGDAKIGFFFDHTTGLPVIPGSSVKGLLRSVFEKDSDKDDNKYTGAESLKAIRFFLSGIQAENNELTTQELDKIKQEIFGDAAEGSGLDIFFDAVPNIIETGQKPILGNDFLTPHINRDHPELSPFTNPNPIQFIKVLPGIGFEFRFCLTNSPSYPKWTSKLKHSLFVKIIMTLGAGAKTNVGYGQFTDVYQNPQKNANKRVEQSITDKGRQNTGIPENSFPKVAIPFLLKDEQFEGTVSEIIGDYYIISFEVRGHECIYRKKKTDKLILAIGDTVKVICANEYTDKNPNISIKPL
ncbi:MAG: type III-B CRISPR module RAMP protein Cmr6 [Bacteroidetes bacterium]|nr:type III-B CRISPR module RAMP protein Cmr6 [Bacteroidota bacterium]